MRGLPKAPRLARRRNRPHGRCNVTWSRLRRRRLQLLPLPRRLQLPQLRHRHPPLRRLCHRRSRSLRRQRSRTRRNRRLPITRFRPHRSPHQKRLPLPKPSPMSRAARGSVNGYRRFRCWVMLSITPGTKPVASPRPSSDLIQFAIGPAFPLAVRPAIGSEDIRHAGCRESPSRDRSAS